MVFPAVDSGPIHQQVGQIRLRQTAIAQESINPQLDGVPTSDLFYLSANRGTGCLRCLQDAWDDSDNERIQRLAISGGFLVQFNHPAVDHT